MCPSATRLPAMRMPKLATVRTADRTSPVRPNVVRKYSGSEYSSRSRTFLATKSPMRRNDAAMPSGIAAPAQKPNPPARSAAPTVALESMTWDMRRTTTRGTVSVRPATAKLSLRPLTRLDAHRPRATRRSTVPAIAALIIAHLRPARSHGRASTADGRPRGGRAHPTRCASGDRRSSARSGRRGARRRAAARTSASRR